MKKTLLKSMLAAAVLFGAGSAFAGDIPGAADAKTGDIGRHETASGVNEWVKPENGVYGIHTFAADQNDWDSQFFIVIADAILDPGTPVSISFQYRKEGEGKVSFNAQGHGDPHAYVNNNGFGTLEATEEWQDYSGEFKVGQKDNGDAPDGDSKGIRTLALNCSIARENGTLYLRNIVIEVNYDDAVVTKETTEDKIDLGDAPEIEVPQDTTPEVAAPYTTVDYEKIGLVDAADSFVYTKKDSTGTFAPAPAKYGDDVVFALFVDSTAVNHWDVGFHVTFESVSSTVSENAILSFEYKDDYAVEGNMWWHNGNNNRHDGLMPWDGAAQIARGLDWVKFNDTLTAENVAAGLTQWEIQFGPDGKKSALPFNSFIKNLTLTIDGEVVYSLAEAKNPVEGAIVENGGNEGGNEGSAVLEAAAVNAFVAGDVLYASEAADVVIYNISGVAVKAAKKVTSLSVSDLKSGLYIAKVGNKAIKFVK